MKPAPLPSTEAELDALFQSDAPEARAFCRWLCHDVLPQIRRTGSYTPTGSTPDLTAINPKERERMRTLLTDLLGAEQASRLFPPRRAVSAVGRKVLPFPAQDPKPK